MQPTPLRLAYLADPNSVHTHRWIGFFAARGHQVDLLIGTDDTVTGSLPEGVRLHRYRRFGRRRLPLLSSLQGRRALRTLLDELRPDVLHAHYLSRHGWQARLSGFHPYVVTPWGSDLFVVPRHSLRARIWARLTLGSADLVTVLSGQMESAVVAAGAQPERVRRILFGVDTERFVPDEAAGSAEQVALDARIIFSPRALRPLYRHETVVDAVALLPPDVRLVMSGRGADLAYRRRIEDRASAAGLGSRIRILDQIDDEEQIRLYRRSAVVVSVPESDGLPSTVLEAMACETPVVVSDVPGLRELIAPVAPALIVPIGDPRALATAVNHVLDLAPAELAVLAKALRTRVVEVADQRVNMLQMEALYAELAAKG